MGTGTASPHKKRTRRFDPNQGDSRSMKQTTLDSYVLGEPNVSDAGSQHWEKRTPQREPASFFSEKVPLGPANQGREDMLCKISSLDLQVKAQAA